MVFTRWVSLVAVVACTEIVVVPEDPADGGGGSEPVSTSASSSSGGAGGPAGACEMKLDWVEEVSGGPFGGELVLSRVDPLAQLLVRLQTDDGSDLATFDLGAFGDQFSASSPLLRGVETSNVYAARSIPGGVGVAWQSGHAFVPSVPGPSIIETASGGWTRVAWDVSGGPYVLRDPYSENPDDVEAPDGTLHELPPECDGDALRSSVGDGVVVRAVCDGAFRTWHVGPGGMLEVDLGAITTIGRGAGDRTLGVGFGGHIYEIGKGGELGDLVATNPADGSVFNETTAQIVPWLEGFAVVMKRVGEQQELRVRAFPAYGDPIDAEPLDVGSAGEAPLSLTAVGDDASRTLLVAYRGGENAIELARFSCLTPSP